LRDILSRTATASLSFFSESQMKALIACSCAALMTSVQVSRAAEPPADSAVEKELKSLQGLWQVVHLGTEGREAPAEVLKPMRWQIHKNKISFIDPNVPKDESTSRFTIDPAKSPKHIDLTASGGRDKGKVLQGIYELKDGRLQVCVRDQLAKDKGRPKEFDGGAGLGLIKFQRIDDKKAE
jgi:uncharacterized protein (TIGR03067 family)